LPALNSVTSGHAEMGFESRHTESERMLCTGRTSQINCV